MLVAIVNSITHCKRKEGAEGLSGREVDCAPRAEWRGGFKFHLICRITACTKIAFNFFINLTYIFNYTLNNFLHVHKPWCPMYAPHFLNVIMSYDTSSIS